MITVTALNVHGLKEGQLLLIANKESFVVSRIKKVSFRTDGVSKDKITGVGISLEDDSFIEGMINNSLTKSRSLLCYSISKKLLSIGLCSLSILDDEEYKVYNV